MAKKTGIIAAATIILSILTYPIACAQADELTYVIVDTGQEACYDSMNEVSPPAVAEAFYGQDAQYAGNQPGYTLSGDGLTVYDELTGLSWQSSADTDGDSEIGPDDKLTWSGCQAYPATLNAQSHGDYTDWRLPTIKELYSLILFSGVDPSGYSGDTSGLVPFIDTDYFDFAYGDESAGERIIDSQYASSNLYVDSSGMKQLLFGVNFADGRIKGYGLTMPGGIEKTFFVQCVRGNTSYGINEFTDNGDGTITDSATELMWMQDDSGGYAPSGLNWEEALEYAENLVCAGHDDWRLPNAKELQSILDYDRSPGTTGSAAIDPLFNATGFTNEAGQADYHFYWSSTTHASWADPPGSFGSYVAFGRAMGYMEGSWSDVHGAGAQRSDPKAGDPDDWPYGNGPQGDAIRIFNFVRCVRDAGTSSGIEVPDIKGSHLINHPNPFKLGTTISFSLPEEEMVQVIVYNVLGEEVARVVDECVAAGAHQYRWEAVNLPGGLYFCELNAGPYSKTIKMMHLP